MHHNGKIYMFWSNISMDDANQTKFNSSIHTNDYKYREHVANTPQQHINNNVGQRRGGSNV